METKQLVELMIQNGIVQPVGDNELQLNDKFLKTIDAHLQIIDDLSISELTQVIETNYRSKIVEILLDIAESNARFVARYMAITEYFSDLKSKETIQLLISLDHLEYGLPPTSGIPPTFVPIRPEEIKNIVKFFEISITYFWRHDCDPCDYVVSQLEYLIEDGALDGVMCLAIYGPDAPVFLRREFDIGGAPTILFFKRGDVDTRLIGGRDKEQIRVEVEKIRDLL